MCTISVFPSVTNDVGKHSSRFYRKSVVASDFYIKSENYSLQSEKKQVATDWQALVKPQDL
jgi:hypothetical protein